MINVFYVSARMAGNKLLTDKSHRDGSPVRRNGQNELKEAVDPIGSLEFDRPVEFMLEKPSLYKKSKGMPVKMLIEQEMSKEIDCGRKSPSVVARLMGLETLPAQRLPTPAPRIIPGGDQIQNRCMLGKAIRGSQQRRTTCNNMVPQNGESFHTHTNKESEYKGVYDVWKQPSRINHFKDESLHKGRYHDNLSEKSVALVHEKFLEAKQLAKSQKLLQSKDFQNALEVLSLHKDIFLKILEEPNVPFPKYLHEKPTATLSNKRKYITVLKPSRTSDNTNERQPRKDMLADVIGWGGDNSSRNSGSTFSKSGSLSQPTRIVVLKPSPKQPLNLRSRMTAPIQSQSPLKGEEFFDESRTNETPESREMAKKITRQMQESLSRNGRDEAMLSSELSNGYTGDESSFSRSEIMCMEEESGNFSDSQAPTPSHHSWDFINRLSSPYSLSSCSQTPCSPESSVIREAKKRLSERLTMVKTNGVNKVQTQLERSSSTLGEMLAIESLRENDSNEETSYSNLGAVEHELVATSSCSSNRVQDLNSEGRPRTASLQKSKSVPSSSSAYNSVNDKEANKSKSKNFSFRGKASGFFSRNKKPNQEKCFPFLHASFLDEASSRNPTSVDYKSTDFAECVVDYQHVEDPINTIEETFREKLLPVSGNRDLKQGPHFVKKMSSIGKPSFSELLSQNIEQPSPVSVLEALFEEDTSTCSSLSRDGASAECRRTVSRSPLIESITRSLSWDYDAHSDGNTSNLKNHPTVGSLAVDIKEQDRLDFVQKLLFSSGLDNETVSSSLSKWYSIESPLNPLLLDKFLERREEGTKCRETRSRQRLLFDCVNVALLEICWNDASFNASQRLKRTSFRTCSYVPDTTLVAEEVIKRVARWFYLDDDSVASCAGGNSSMVVDCVIKKDVCGRGWEDMLFFDIMEIGMEIERLVLDELVVEAIDGL